MVGNQNEAFKTACMNWKLTEQGVKKLFENSELYEYSPYQEYYQVPCEIVGTLRNNDKIWKFTINGGGTSIWESEGKKKYFGCNKVQCEALVLIRTDGMAD